MTLSSNERAVDMSVWRGRNGEEDPTRLLTPEGRFNGQAEEVKALRDWNGVLESKPGEAMYGAEISATGATLGTGKWGDNVMVVHGTSLYMYEGGSYYAVKTGLTASARMTYLEYYGELLASNKKDYVQRCIRGALTGDITDSSTTIPIDYAYKFENDKNTVTIQGDEIDYIGVSNPTIVAKTANFTTTNANRTLNGDATGGVFTFTLVTAVGNKGLIHILRKTDASANAITVDANGGELIDNAATVTLASQGDVSVIKSDGVAWYTCTLEEAGATVLDNVTSIAVAHSIGDYAVQVSDATQIPKGGSLEEYGEKLWLADIDATSDNNRYPIETWYSATADAEEPEKFREFKSEEDTKYTRVYAGTYVMNGSEKHFLLDASAGNITVNMIPASGLAGTNYIWERLDDTGNTVTIDPSGAETWDGENTVVLVGEGAKIVGESDGTNWVTTTEDAVGSGFFFFSSGGNTTAVKKYRDVLILSQEEEVRYVSGFTDTGGIPIPNKVNLYRSSGAVNGNCIVQMENDIVYFSKDKRINRLFTSEGYEGFRHQEDFDYPILDILDSLDDDLDEVSMIYNKEKKYLCIAAKSNGSAYNDIRIIYSMKNNAWYFDENYFCKDFVIVDGITYYGHSIIGRVIKMDEGFTKDGISEATLYRSMHYNTSMRDQFVHHHFKGEITTATEITINFYVDGDLVKTATIDSDDIVDSESKYDVPIGYGVIGYSVYGKGSPTQDIVLLTKKFDKWITLGDKGKEYHYELITNGVAQTYKIDKSEIYIKDTATKSQSTT